MMHPLDEKYWSQRENWKWWCYTCPDDPRTIVPKRPRWAGYTINVAHSRSWLVLAGLIALILVPVLAVIFLAPQQEVLLFGVSGIIIAITVAVCHRAANPKEWKDGAPNHTVGVRQMKHKTYMMLLTACLLAGCASSRSVLCVAPQGQFTPESESELLSELNAQLPFSIPQNRFITMQKSNGLVGWAVVRNDEEKDVAKAKLEKSSTLTLLQVEALTHEFEAVMKQHKK